MPNVNYIDMTPTPRNQKPSSLAGFAGGFAGKVAQRQEQKQEADALSEIYKQYENDDKNLDTMLKAVNTNPTISNLTKVNTANQIVQMKKYNYEQQKAAAKTQKEQNEKLAKEKVNQEYLTDLETKNNMTPGSLQKYKDRPELAKDIVKEKKTPISQQSIPADQMALINQSRNDPTFQNSDPYQKYQILTNAGVSSTYAKSEADIASNNIPPYETESSKIDAKRTGGYIDEVEQQGKSADIKLRGLNEAYELLNEGATGFKIGNYLADYFGVPALADPKSTAFNAAMKSQYSGIGDIVKGKVSNFEFQVFQGMIADAKNHPQAAEMLLVSAMMESKIRQKERDIVDAKRMQNHDAGKQNPPNFDIEVRKELQPYADLIMHDTIQKMRNIITPTKKENSNNSRLQEIFK